MEETRTEREDQRPSPSSWLVGLVVLLLVAAVIGFGYAYRQQQTVGQLRAHEEEMNSTVGQMRSQVDAMTAKLAEMSSSNAPGVEGQSGPAPTRAGKRGAASDRRLKQIQAQLTEHKKQLEATQQEVEKNRSELEGQLGSTRDELNGSIARTHDELVVLEKRGERNYYEFALGKSKEFQRVGPISLELRRADAKHQSYDLMLLVDDFRLNKRKVNLYEPVWIHRSDYPQPLQLIVNRIEKNRVLGYVSEPKYKLSELSASATPATPENQQLAKPQLAPRRPQEQQLPQQPQEQPPQ
jgi:hypothetical protein